MTILFTDVAGSTALGERFEPEAVRRVMMRYFAAASSVVERHGGTVEKFIGDAVMAVFGVPMVQEDHALRAIGAALELQDELVALNDDLGANGVSGSRSAPASTAARWWRETPPPARRS